MPVLVSKSLVRKVIKRKVKQLSSGSNASSDLYLLIKEIIQTDKRWAFLKTTGRERLTENEVAALGKISAALRKHSLMSRFPKIVERFHLLCLGLIRSVGPFTTSSVQQFQGHLTQNHIVSQVFYNQMRASKNFNGHHRGPGYDEDILANEKWISLGCEDMRNGSDLECFGMCGKLCWCWDWVCGDCCLHRGCLQHDACCRCTNPHYLSTYCLLPFIYGFDCNHGYNGYPECLHNS